jgi:hypothetical protein
LQPRCHHRCHANAAATTPPPRCRHCRRAVAATAFIFIIVVIFAAAALSRCHPGLSVKPPLTMPWRLDLRIDQHR